MTPSSSLFNLDQIIELLRIRSTTETPTEATTSTTSTTKGPLQLPVDLIAMYEAAMEKQKITNEATSTTTTTEKPSEVSLAEIFYINIIDGVLMILSNVSQTFVLIGN